MFFHRSDGDRVRRLEATLAAIERSQAIIEFGLDGAIVRANENFLSVMGYSEPEVLGRHHSMFVDFEKLSTADYEDFWRTLNAGQFVAAKFERLAKGGRRVWIQASYNPVFDSNGRPTSIIKVATDVTALEHERRRNEHIRKAAAEEQRAVVDALGEALERLAAGDLTADLPPFPETYASIRENLNQALGSLSRALGGIDDSVASLHSACGEIASATNDLSRRTEHQAATLEETAAALEQLTVTVNKSAENAGEAAQAASRARAQAESSGEVVRSAVSAMHRIDQSSRNINQIIGVIDEIAFQTNLLALNAGVEAARAGDAGRGFAVVASEVRSLAQRSAEAAKEIKALIRSSGQEVAKGVELVAATGEALENIVSGASHIDDRLSEIAASAHEQSQGLTQLNTALSQMDQVTQQNAAMVEQTTAAAAQMKVQADSLAARARAFRLRRSDAELGREPRLKVVRS